MNIWCVLPGHVFQQVNRDWLVCQNCGKKIDVRVEGQHGDGS
jgi:transcription elongation factor Elf1